MTGQRIGDLELDRSFALKSIARLEITIAANPLDPHAHTLHTLRNLIYRRVKDEPFRKNSRIGHIGICRK
jgi:hypothetical protein